MWPVTDGEEAWCVVPGSGIAGPTSTSSRGDKPPGREHSEATGHHRPLGSVCAQPRHCRSSASPVPLRCCHRSAGSASKARRPAGDGLASNACPDGAPGPAEVIQIGVQVEIPVCGEWLFPSKLGRCLTRSRRTAGNQRADSRGMLTLVGLSPSVPAEEVDHLRRIPVRSRSTVRLLCGGVVRRVSLADHSSLRVGCVCLHRHGNRAIQLVGLRAHGEPGWTARLPLTAGGLTCAGTTVIAEQGRAG